MRGPPRTVVGGGEAGAADEAPFAIYAHPSDPDAQTAAERLQQALSSTAASVVAQGRQGQWPVLRHAPSNCPGCAIYFCADGHVELLVEGQSAGKGLKSELSKVLLDLCSRKGPRPRLARVLCMGCLAR